MIQPTELQKKAVEILKDNPNIPVGRAMREAGYSHNTSLNPSKDFLELKGTQVALEQWREALRGSGLGEKKLLEKYKEWLDAERVSTSLTEPDKIVPDYATQTKAGEWLREDLGVKQDKPQALTQVNIGGDIGVEFVKDDTSQTK